ncbi:Acg family FMN-binding oxidoreductase [Amycolatopsis taiwanensis]|uniref:NAD(P)H nitroreductase n=1 Tax=Amycolatopsis taiwanensis TaxID=342230 RepID=A0A9W6VFZ5_9PSEU|nr:NAD(P)H nitroreductase [Amycolatopsis taiwanensis]GLY64986.1 NAD(P)H nitroreductase [Amycolatopsis taiwanensis]
MDPGLPDDYTVYSALALAVRAPSLHNSQPWIWQVGARTVQLYADRERLLPETDPEGRDLLLSCGAALHHLRAGFAALGWRTEVHRLPDPAEPDRLAAIEFHPHEPSQTEIALAAAIPRRRTDRRRYTSWPVPTGYLEDMAVQAADEGTVFRTADGPARDHIAAAIREAARAHASDPDYQAELAAWSGRYESPEGVPAANVPAPDETPGALPGRGFAEPRLAQPSAATAEEEYEDVLAVIATASDDPMSQLRAGEATSAVALLATSVGLASCPLTEALEIHDTRDLIRSQVTGGNFPQMVLRLGWAPVNADPLPATPRRPLEEVVRDLPPRPAGPPRTTSR